MWSKPTHDGIFIRWLVIAVYKILTSKHIYRWSKHPGPVIFISSRLCIKSTPFTTLAEAETMRFIARNTTIPVPKVYCAFEHKGRVYVVMERIQGQALWYGWVRRPQESKDKILQSLKLMIQQLHSITPPSNVGVSNISGGPIFDQRLPNNSLWGPFSTIREFHMKLCDGLGELTPNQTLPSDLDKLAAFYNRPWPTPTFTHGDLSSSNIIVQGDEVVGIVDWETAGWMPPYWEYTSARNVNPQNQFWQMEVDNFLPPIPEALEMEKIKGSIMEIFLSLVIISEAQKIGG
jgi:aminoglycoside phosphotransferase